MNLLSKALLSATLIVTGLNIAHADNFSSKALKGKNEKFKAQVPFQATRNTLVKIEITKLHKINPEGYLVGQGSVNVETMIPLSLPIGHVAYLQNGQILSADQAETMNDSSPYCTLRSDEADLNIPARTQLNIEGVTDDNYWSTWLPWNWNNTRYTSEIFLARYWNPDIYQMVTRYEGYQVSIECGKDRPEGSDYDVMNFQDFEKAVSPAMKIISIHLPK